jgi:leukotriene-A4 hydrolase
MARLDPHSYSDSEQPETASFTWRARIDFERQLIEGNVLLALRPSAAIDRGGPLDLDTRELGIDAVVDDAGRPLTFELAQADPILGTRLRIQLAPGVAQLRIFYRTSERASALQWLTPAQTASGRHPYLFSQCQAIHARSVLPLQDTPRVRVPYTAALDVPRELRSLMAARFVRREALGAERALDHWEMPQPIPPYLLALAVGDVQSRELSPRVRVWAEPNVVEAAADEFQDVEPMIEAAERLFGPYDWERFDLLVMPPSFPYGGMENPRLTFLTPTLLTGDRSLVNVVAHELAHSWTGNLVSNASAEHFWLNEGFTVYAERRILEALDGRELAELHAAVGRRELQRDFEQFLDQPALTRLRTHLEGIDPDQAFSGIPYEKGYLFLRALEESEGRVAWDAFLRRYMAAFRFRALTTEEFMAFLERELPGAAGRVHATEYLDGTGLPASAPVARSERLDTLLAVARGVPLVIIDARLGASLSPIEWKLYLDSLPRPTPIAGCAELDARFQLTQSRNAEILCAWLLLALESRHSAVLPRVEAFLGEVGRMKFLRPLYATLAANPETRPIARALFERWRRGYHPIAESVVEKLLAKADAAKT